MQTVTTNTTFNKDKTSATKLTVKYPHASGFTLEKLEFKHDGHIVTETSLTGTAPGLKLEFKGDDEKSKGDLIVTYVVPKVTLTSELDILNLNKFSVSATGGQGPVTAGVAANVNLTKQSLDSVNVAVGYTAPQFYGVARANNTFKDFSGSAKFQVNDKLTVAAKVSHGDKGVSGAAAAIYACCPNNIVKVKAGTCGGISASLKRSYEKKFTVVTAISTNASSISDFKWGVNATLG